MTAHSIASSSRILRDAGLDVTVLGDRVLCCSQGGRVLGLYPEETDNLLWTNPELLSEPSEFLGADGWLNSGGDRTWISPEVSFNGSGDSWSTYSVPESLDPGIFAITDISENSVAMQNHMTLQPLTGENEMHLILNRTIELSADPPIPVPDGVRWSGYRTTTMLSNDGPQSGDIRPAIWNILQVPGGGDLVVPTRGYPGIQPFFGPVSADSNTERTIVRGAAVESFKGGIHVDFLKGVMLYLRRLSEGRDSVVFRSFTVTPGGRYGDVPADDASATGYIGQFYVDDGGLGGYLEMEYHSQEILRNETTRTDESDVYGFIGSPQQIEKLCILFDVNLSVDQY